MQSEHMTNSGNGTAYRLKGDGTGTHGQPGPGPTGTAWEPGDGRQNCDCSREQEDAAEREDTSERELTMREVPQRLASPSEETPLKKKKKKNQISVSITLSNSILNCSTLCRMPFGNLDIVYQLPYFCHKY